MARPRKISEEKLFSIIKEYIESKPYISTLKYSNLVEYAKSELGYENISYQDFSRNKKVKEFVEIYKKRKSMTSYIKVNSNRLEKFNFSVDDLVDRYNNDLKQLKAILKVFKEAYDKAFDLLIEGKQNDIKNMGIIKEQEKEINELKKKNTTLRAQLDEQIKKNSNSYRMEKLKWMYLTVQDMISQNNFYIETEDEIMDILKNFGYSSNDIVDVHQIIKDEFVIEELSVVSKNDNEDKKKKDYKADVDNNKVVDLKQSKLILPDFMK